MENELDILKQKKEININEFNITVGNIDKDQEKVEKMVNTKEQNVLVLAYDAYKDFLFLNLTQRIRYLWDNHKR